MLDSKIETFLAVVELKNYTVVANKLHMTQPAVTQHIHKLEEYYNCSLVDSKNRSITITKEGELLYTYLKMQVANSKQITSLLHQNKKPFCIGATLSIADYYLFPFLSKELLYNTQRKRIIVGNTASLIDKLHNGIIDCAFIEGMFQTTMFETHVFKKENFIAVASSNHPLAHKKIYLHDLYKYPLILREPNSGTREIFELWLYQNNLSTQLFQKQIEIGSFTFIKNLVKEYDAITFLYEGVVKEEIKNGTMCILNIQDYSLQHDMLFVYRKGDPNQKECLAFLNSLHL